MFRSWLIVGLVFLSACGGAQNPDADAAAKAKADEKNAAVATSATAVLHPTESSVATGIVNFSRKDGGVFVDAEFQGLSAGMHRFHIHDVGDCSDPQAKTAGKPLAVSETGDFQNVNADEKGAARMEFLVQGMELDGPGGIIGKSVIIHRTEDSQDDQSEVKTSGRLACGVIIAN